MSQRVVAEVAGLLLAQYSGCCIGARPRRAILKGRVGELFPGAEFAGYVIEDVIGRGGMGVIYRASEPRQPARLVALKVVAPELATDEDFRQRFLREAQVAASIEHPNVVPVLRVGEEKGALYRHATDRRA